MSLVQKWNAYRDHGRRHKPGGSDPIPGISFPNGHFEIKVFGDADTVVTGDGAFILEIDTDLDGYTLVHVRAFVTTVSSSGNPTVQIRNATQLHDMLSTKITIDASERSSMTAATTPVIDAGNAVVAEGDQIAIDVDVAGTGAKGLGVMLVFQHP